MRFVTDREIEELWEQAELVGGDNSYDVDINGFATKLLRLQREKIITDIREEADCETGEFRYKLFDLADGLERGIER